MQPFDDEPTEQAPRPCPFCGDRKQRTRGEDRLDYWVQCGECGARGPLTLEDFSDQIRRQPRGVLAQLALLAGPPRGVGPEGLALLLFEAWGQDARVEPHIGWIELWVEQDLLPEVELGLRMVRLAPAPWSREELEYGADIAAGAYPSWMDDRAIRAAKSTFSRPLPEGEAEREQLFDSLVDYFAMNPKGWRLDGMKRWYKQENQ